MATYYPYLLKHLAKDVDTRYRKLGPKRKVWVLDIIGPFCFVRGGVVPRKLHVRAAQITNSVSALLSLPASYNYTAKEINIKIILDQETRTRLIRKNYISETEDA